MAVSVQILWPDKLGEKIGFQTFWMSELRIKDCGAKLTFSKDLGRQ